MSDQTSSSSFARTTRVLRLTRFRRHSHVIGVLTLLFGAWLTWLGYGRVEIYSLSQRARLESTTLPTPVDVPVDGVIEECRFTLGAHYAAGDVLVRLDTRDLALKRSQTEALIASDDAAVKALSRQLDAQTAARSSANAVVEQTRFAGDAKVAVSEKASSYKRNEADVIQKLNESSLASRLDTMHAEEAAGTSAVQAQADSAQRELDLATSRALVRERDTQISGLQKSLADARAARDLDVLKIASIDHDLDLRTIRARISGTLADVAPCTPGMVVQHGKEVATIVSDGSVRVVTFFRPEDVIGRVHAGQHAVLRLDNYPWTQYGTVSAIVTRVGMEPRDGVVRVELTIDSNKSTSAIPIVHGLTGSCEIEVEQLPPLRLLLRMAGQQLSSPTSPTPEPDLAKSGELAR